MEGNIEDVNALTLDKYPDFQVAKATLDDLSLRLSHAFLLSTGTIRNAERVTAEEVRLQAQELEDVLGGVYTVLSKELQLPIVRRLMVQLRKSGLVNQLPKNALDPQIVTGFDALGRGHELNKLRTYFSDGASLFGEEFLSHFSIPRVAQLLAVNHNVSVAELMKTQDEYAADAQNNMQATMLDKATGPVAGAAAKSLTSD